MVHRMVILAGGTYSNTVALASSLGMVPRIIECICDDEVARERLERELARGGHPAGNRTYPLYQSLKAGAVLFTVPRLVLDTGRLTVEQCLEKSREYLAGG